MLCFTVSIRQSFTFFYIYVTFVKIINVDKNNKRVYYKFLVNVASVYDIYGLSHVSGRHVLVGLQYRASVVTASS